MEREGEVGWLKSNRDIREIAFVMKEDTCEMNFMMNYISKAVTREKKKKPKQNQRQQVPNGIISCIRDDVLITYKPW